MVPFRTILNVCWFFSCHFGSSSWSLIPLIHQGDSSPLDSGPFQSGNWIADVMENSFFSVRNMTPSKFCFLLILYPDLNDFAETFFELIKRFLKVFCVLACKSGFPQIEMLNSKASKKIKTSNKNRKKAFVVCKEKTWNKLFWKETYFFP